MSDRARRLWHIAAVLAIAGIPVVASVFNLATPFIPYGRFGFAAGDDGTISSVVPSSAAARAGLKPGDRIAVAALSAQERIYLHWPLTLAGRKAEFPLSNGAARSVALVAHGRSSSSFATVSYFAVFFLLALSDIAIVLIGAALALAYPSRMTWAFLFYAAGSQPGSPILIALLSAPWVVAYSAFCGVLWFGSSAALVVFALRFPNDRVSGAGAIADRWLPRLAIAFAPLVIAANVGLVYRGLDTDAFEQSLTTISTALYCLAVIVFAVRYYSEGRAERPRMAWVIASFLVGYAGIVAARIFESVGFSPPPNVTNFLLALNVTVPAAVAYAIFKQRVISVRFFVRKALVFGVLVAIAIGGIVLLDWLIARRVERLFSSAGSVAVVAVNVAAALLLGFLMPALYEAIRDLVDRWFFRQQYLARQQVLQLAEGLAYADSAETIDEVLVHSVAGSLEIGSVAVFVRGEDGAFRREAAKGWGDDMLERRDAERLAVAFEGAHGALRFADVRPPIGQNVPAGDAAPAVGFPIFVRRKLSRFVLFSGHPHGLELDPSETRLLGEVTRSASYGFDAIELAARVEEAQAEALETLRRSNAALQRFNEAYERFVPGEFLSFLQKESIVDVALGDWVKKTMTVLFSDMRSFTTISEGMSPEQTFRFLNEYLKRVGPLIRENGGFIDKYIGDAVMGLFPEKPDDALRAAIALHREVRLHNRRLADDGLPTIAIGAGLHVGELMLGTIGERGRMDTTVIADTVNIASRLEGVTKRYQCSIVLSREIVESLQERNRFLLRYLGALQLKGKAKALAVHECYDADPAEIAHLKIASSERFAAAIAAFEDGEWRQALDIFSEICALNAGDGPARYYVRRCSELIESGHADGWSHVEVLDQK